MDRKGSSLRNEVTRNQNREQKRRTSDEKRAENPRIVSTASVEEGEVREVTAAMKRKAADVLKVYPTATHDPEY
jgi:hypothetical protein